MRMPGSGRSLMYGHRPGGYFERPPHTVPAWCASAASGAAERAMAPVMKARRSMPRPMPSARPLMAHPPEAPQRLFAQGPDLLVLPRPRPSGPAPPRPAAGRAGRALTPEQRGPANGAETAAAVAGESRTCAFPGGEAITVRLRDHRGATSCLDKPVANPGDGALSPPHLKSGVPGHGLPRRGVTARRITPTPNLRGENDSIMMTRKALSSSDQNPAYGSIP